MEDKTLAVDLIDQIEALFEAKPKDRKELKVWTEKINNLIKTVNENGGKLKWNFQRRRVRGV